MRDSYSANTMLRGLNMKSFFIPNHSYYAFVERQRGGHSIDRARCLIPREIKMRIALWLDLIARQMGSEGVQIPESKSAVIHLCRQD